MISCLIYLRNMRAQFQTSFHVSHETNYFFSYIQVEYSNYSKSAVGNFLCRCLTLLFRRQKQNQEKNSNSNCFGWTFWWQLLKEKCRVKSNDNKMHDSVIYTNSVHLSQKKNNFPMNNDKTMCLFCSRPR